MVKQRSTVLLQFVEMQLIVVQEEEEDDCKHQEWETVLAPDDNYGNKRRCDGSASHGQEIGCRTSKWPAEHHRDFTFNLEGGSCAPLDCKTILSMGDPIDTHHTISSSMAIFFVNSGNVANFVFAGTR